MQRTKVLLLNWHCSFWAIIKRRPMNLLQSKRLLINLKKTNRHEPHLRMDAIRLVESFGMDFRSFSLANCTHRSVVVHYSQAHPGPKRTCQVYNFNDGDMACR